MIHYLLFDLDGTLTDPKEGITRCVQHALHHFGIEEPDLNKLTPFIGPPLIPSFREFYGLSMEEAEEAVRVYRERFSTVGLFENEVLEGIPEMLEALQDAGAYLAVASSKPEEYVLRILEHFDLRRFFDSVTGASMDETRAGKDEVIREAMRRILRGADEPSFGQEREIALEPASFGQEREIADEPVPFGQEREIALEPAYAGISPELSTDLRARFLMIGDRKHDVLGAKKNGITCLGVYTGFAEEGELEEAGADYIAENVREMKEILLDLLSSGNPDTGTI